ncbi:MAG: hypothetical protein RQ735_02595 [Flavobacteriaceae bacterium]|nr:hypothetical protein [Flavobacteriaceae bacterium]
MRKILIIISSLLCLQSCDNTTLPSGSELLSKAIEAHGGMEAWQSVAAIAYKKRIVVFEEDGTISSDVTQHILYRFQPVFSGKMWWLSDGVMHQVVFDGQQTQGYKDSIPDNTLEGKKEAFNTFMASYVTFAQPFKLSTDKAVLTTEQKIIHKGKSLYRVRVAYPDVEGENKDVWWYFFDVQDHRVAANLVLHNGRYSFIENTAYDTKTPFVFNAARQSSFTDSLLQNPVLRANYQLSDIEVALVND